MRQTKEVRDMRHIERGTLSEKHMTDVLESGLRIGTLVLGDDKEIECFYLLISDTGEFSIAW